MSGCIHTVIAGHGSFPQGLLSAAERIAGRQEGVVIISNDELSAPAFQEKLKQGLTGANNGVYIFIDIAGGSCFTAARSLIPSHPDLVFITGVNLSMLVTYLSYRTRLSGEELLRKTIEAGQRGIQNFGK